MKFWGEILKQEMIFAVRRISQLDNFDSKENLLNPSYEYVIIMLEGFDDRNKFVGRFERNICARFRLHRENRRLAKVWKKAC